MTTTVLKGGRLLDTDGERSGDVVVLRYALSPRFRSEALEDY